MPELDPGLEEFSIENLIRKATQPRETLRIPMQYMQQKPDTLALDSEKALRSMALPGVDYGAAFRDPPPPVGKPGVPYAYTNYDGRMPVVGRDVSLEDITKWVKAKESSGNYTALNTEQKGNTASGAYQYTDATWNGYGGYPKAMLAPPKVQDARFAEDIRARFKKFHGDPFKMIAAHYLPAAADEPETWTKPYRLPSGKVVKPVAEYVRYVVRGTPLEEQLDAYLARQQ